jgi:MFS family permease
LPKALLPIFLIIVVDILGMAIIFPLLPFYAEHLGATPAEVGLLVSTFAVCQLFGGPMLGRLSDHVGRKPLLVLSQLGTLIGFGMLAWAGSLWLVFLSRAIDGFTAGNISLAQAYIADITKPEQRTRSFAVIGIAFGVGFLIGPAIGGFLSQWGYQLPIFAAMALSAASILATQLLLPASAPSAAAPRRFTSPLCCGSSLRSFLLSLRSCRASPCLPNAVLSGRDIPSDRGRSATSTPTSERWESFCRED